MRKGKNIRKIYKMETENQIIEGRTVVALGAEVLTEKRHRELSGVMKIFYLRYGLHGCMHLSDSLTYHI